MSEIRDHNNYIVKDNDLVGVLSGILFRKLGLDEYNALYNKYQQVHFSGNLYFRMTAREAIDNEWPATVLDNGIMPLNSHIGIRWMR